MNSSWTTCAIMAIVSTLIGAVGTRAETAASIEYNFHDRPASVPAELTPQGGANLRFLAIKAIDGFRVDAALWQPDGKTPDATTLVVAVHGSGGNFVESAGRLPEPRSCREEATACSRSIPASTASASTPTTFWKYAGTSRRRSHRTRTRLSLARALRAQPRQHPGAVLRRQQLGSGYQGRGARRHVRKSALEVAQYADLE